MWILITTVDKETRAIAVSKDKDLLRKKLVKNARKYIKDYYFNSCSDEYGRNVGNALLNTLKGFSEDYWEDGDEECPVTYRIMGAPVIFKPGKPIYVKMAFGSEIVDSLDWPGENETKMDILNEFKDTESLVVRRFNTRSEKRAYLQGVSDNYGWNKYSVLNDMFPSVARLIPNKTSD